MTSWTPGFRRPPKGAITVVGKHMIALSSIARLTFRVLRNNPLEKNQASDIADDTIKEAGDNISLSVTNGYKSVVINLTGLNASELDTMKSVIDLAMEHARPIVEERDRVAEEAANRGEDIFYRRHRPAPTLSIFQRPRAADAQGVPNGPEDVLGRDEPAGGDPPR